MTYQGIVQNGMILVAEGICLPEGAEVQIKLAEGKTSPSEETDEPTVGQRLADLARKYENLPCDLPEDLASNHDHYLHGV